MARLPGSMDVTKAEAKLLGSSDVETVEISPAVGVATVAHEISSRESVGFLEVLGAAEVEFSAAEVLVVVKVSLSEQAFEDFLRIFRV